MKPYKLTEKQLETLVSIKRDLFTATSTVYNLFSEEVPDITHGYRLAKLEVKLEDLANKLYEMEKEIINEVSN